MVVLRVSVVCAAYCVLLLVHPQATAQVFNATTGSGAAQTGPVVPRHASEKTAPGAKKASPDPSGVKQTSWYSVPMPRITMPKIEIPRFKMPSFLASSGASSADKPSMFAPLTAGAHKISAGSKKAWQGAKEMFSVGRRESDKKVPQAAAKKGPSLWERMFTRKEPKGPRTVAEWMAQPRLDP